MIDNPFIKNSRYQRIHRQIQSSNRKAEKHILSQNDQIYKDSIKKDPIIGDCSVLYESAVTYMNSFATSTLRMLLCIVHLVKIFIQKNSLTSRTQLKRVTLFQRSTPSRPDHVLNEIVISLNSRKNQLRIRPCWDELSRTTQLLFIQVINANQKKVVKCRGVLKLVCDAYAPMFCMLLL